MCGTVRNYVEAMRDSSQLLDLLSVAGSNDIETTKAAAGRTVLYPNVRASLHSPT
jgi:exosome complex exonuclease DIS3/RRP44